MRNLQKIFFLGCLLLCSFCGNAQDVIQWQKCLGGSDYDFGIDGHQTSDGGYIMAGVSSSDDGQVSGNHGSWDFWVVKLNDTGAIQWQKSLGGSALDGPRSIIQTADGGYIVAGFSKSEDGDVTTNYGDSDVWVVKLNDTGAIQWQKSLGGSGIDYANCIIQSADGNYMIAGGSQSTDGDVTGNHGDFDMWIVKLSTTGDIMWEKSLGGSGTEGANSIAQIIEGGYIIAGFTNSHDGQVTGCHPGGANDYWVVKIDDTGHIEWEKCLGGTAGDFATSVVTNSNQYIIAGNAYSNDGDVTGNHGATDYWVVKLNATGDILWQKCLGGSENEAANCIKQTADNGIVVIGETYSNDGDVTGNHGFSDCWLVKLNTAGTLEWQKTLGGSMLEFGSFVEETSDGSFVTGGTTSSNDGDVSGYHGGDVDYWILKLNHGGTELIPAPITENTVSVYPNPTSDIINIKAMDKIMTELVSVTGANVILRSNNTVLNTVSLPAGLYMLNVYNADGMKIKVEKIIKN